MKSESNNILFANQDTMESSNTKHILFRADAHPAIGSGDLMSLIHLSKYFEKSGWATSFLIKDYPAARQMVSDYDVGKVQILSRESTVSDEVAAINQILDENTIDMVFFEITANRLSEYTGISSHVAKACVSFDGTILPDMDVVIDWDVAADQFYNPGQYPETTFMLGPEFVILPTSFNRNRIENRIHQMQPKKLLVCMGGADEYNYTGKIVDVLINHGVQMEITIVIGYGYPHKEKLEKKIRTASTKCNIRHNITTMFEEYMACDVAVGAGGLTASELVATRTPAVLLATYNHQIARCEYFHKKKWATYLGYRFFRENDLIHAIDHPPSISRKNIFNTQSIVDTCNDVVD